MTLLRHVSFVDCPGHDILMATMLNGAAVMDAALLLIAGNEPCPQPQTSEHLAAIEIMKLQHIIILQNKVDLMKESVAEEHYQSIKKFIKGTGLPSPSYIVSARLREVGLTIFRDRGRKRPHHPHLCPTQIQYRRRQRIHSKAHPHSTPRLHCRPPSDRHPLL